ARFRPCLRTVATSSTPYEVTAPCWPLRCQFGTGPVIAWPTSGRSVGPPRLRERCFPARDGVRDAGGSSDHEDRRVVGGCPGGAEQRRIAHEDDRPGRRVDLLAVDREERVSGHHGEELLVSVRFVLLVVGLVMLLD